MEEGKSRSPENQDFFRLLSEVNLRHTPELERILQENPHLLSNPLDGSTLLHRIIAECPTETVLRVTQDMRDANVRDKEGNTVVHLSVAQDNPEVTQAVLRAGTDIRVLNNKLESAVHVAVTHDSYNALKVLLKHCPSSSGVRGWKGETPLHVAALHDNLQCFKMLVSSGADIFSQSDSGSTPLHLAVFAGAVSVCNHIMELCKARYGSEKLAELLAIQDTEQQTPMHAAVLSGDFDVVKIMLEAGASISLQMFEGSTVLHLAAARGDLAVIRAIYDTNLPGFKKAIVMKDAEGMTPLHRSAMFNHWELFEFLVSKGAPLDAQDVHGRTPLVLASSWGAWDSVCELLRLGANPWITTADGQIFLHLAVNLGGSPKRFKPNIENSKFGAFEDLLNYGDHSGNRCLHIAAAMGFSAICQDLLLLGADPVPRTNDSLTPLHSASMNGRYRTLQSLLKNSSLLAAVNETSTTGRTALHLAAEKGYGNIVKLLLTKDAAMLCDINGRLPIHYACSLKDSSSVSILLNAHPDSLDAPDNKGNTPLHTAASARNPVVMKELIRRSAAILMNAEGLTALDIVAMNRDQACANVVVSCDRWMELLQTSSTVYGKPVMGWIDHLPGPLLNALDRCRYAVPPNHPGAANGVAYNFRLLEPTEGGVDDGNANVEPLVVLKQMLRYRRVELLRHPVTEALLDLKWRSYGVYFNIFNLILYILFVGLLSYLVMIGVNLHLKPRLKMLSLERIQKYRPDWIVNKTRVGPVDFRDVLEKDYDGVDHVFLGLVLVFALIHLLKKGYQVYLQRWNFLTRLGNYFEIVLYFSTVIFAAGFFDNDDHYVPWDSQWLLGAVSVLFAWINLFFHLKRYGEVGIQVLIYQKVAKTLAEVMVLFFIVLFAFSLTFHVLYPIRGLPDDSEFFQKDRSFDGIEHIFFNAYSTLTTSIIRVTDQLIGDAQPTENWVSPALTGKMEFPVATSIVTFMSIMVVTILLQATIIGLIVGDIGEIRGSLTLQSKATLINLLSDIEEKFPRILRNTFRRAELVVYPSDANAIFTRLLKWWNSGRALEEDTIGGTLSARGVTDLGTLLTENSSQVANITARVNKQYEVLKLVMERMERDREDPEARKQGGKWRKKKSSSSIRSPQPGEHSSRSEY